MSASEDGNPSRSCVFCGSTSNLTREHVLPDWLTEIGLGPTPSEHRFGRLNRVPRPWPARPFTTTVKMVCAACNNGWLSALEGAAKPVLKPLIRGDSRHLSDDDQILIAAWTYKTALVSLLQHSRADRLDGYGVPSIEVVGAGSPPDIPSGYAMTVVVGKLLVQGVRFTAPALQVELTTARGFLDIWPPADVLPWPKKRWEPDGTTYFSLRVSARSAT